ncbi:MAG: tropomyosin 1 [Candidatus Magnetoglobus multicellularis str. Araruama]|uniref:Tropomyosin 1 n=1 Tax=Candidatus Magnetoglobus multicellularis str. Araruama TaxID=890399 RepID=A0A1V1PHQ9_9BACT|nr:MAG: tropomyosin 1 [Candidatus Magnetoglobus multicellularis str. Araruama]
MVHDILFKEWGRLHGWIQENRDFRLWRKRIQSKMWYWEKNGQKNEDLLTGELLTDSLQWLTNDANQIEFSEKRYIQNSAAKNKPDATKQGLTFISRCILLFILMGSLGFGIWYVWDINRNMTRLSQKNATLFQDLVKTQKKLSHTKIALDNLNKKFKESEKKWQNALDKASSADHKIAQANEKLQSAQDIKWRSEQQMQFATQKLKESKTLLTQARKKQEALKEQTQEFENHYQEQVAAIQRQTLELEEQKKQAEIKMAAAEQLAQDAQAQLQLVSEKKAQSETLIQEMKQKQATLTQAACAFALTHLTLDEWRVQMEKSPLKTICK